MKTKQKDQRDKEEEKSDQREGTLRHQSISPTQFINESKQKI